MLLAVIGKRVSKSKKENFLTEAGVLFVDIYESSTTLD